MDQLELKKIKKIYNELNSIAKVGRNNYLEYFNYVDELVNKSQYSLLNTCLLLNYGIDYTQYKSIYDLKNLTWDIICFQTLTPLDEKLKVLYDQYDVYQVGKDIYSNDLSYFEIKISLPLSYTYSYTEYTSQVNVYENNGEINLRLIDTNLYQIEIYKDYLIQVITSGTYSTLYDVNINGLKTSKDSFKTLIPMYSGEYEIITYSRSMDQEDISNLKSNKIYKYKLNIDIKNRLGTINEIDSNDYFSGQYDTYYNKYSSTHYNKNEQIDNTLGLRRKFLNVVKYKNDVVDKTANIIQVNPYYSENLNLYWRYVSAIEFLTKKNVYKARTLNQNVYAAWNSESIMYSLYNLLYGVWNGSSLKKSEYGDFDIEPVGDVILEGVGDINSSGLSNYVYNFESGYFKLPDDSLNFNGDFCINIRIFISDFNKKQKILSCYNKYEDDIYGWYIEIDRNIDLVINNCELSFNVRMNDYKMYKAICYIPTELINNQNGDNINTWINICINYNKIGSVSFHLNGKYSTSYNLNNNLNKNLNILYSNLNKCSIGSGLFLKNESEDTISMGSKIDSVYTWTRNLLSSEISSIYNKGESLEFPFTKLIESSNDWLNAFNATMSNVAINSSGKVGKCFLFGSQSHISLPTNSLNINNFSEFSLSMWINFKEIGMTQSILCCKDNNNNGYDFILNNQNRINISYLKDNYSFNINGPILDKNNWYLLNITILKDSVKSVLNLYVNSKNYLKDIQIDQTSSLSTINPKIGASLTNGSLNNYISKESKVDSITIWNKILNESDINFLFNDGLGVEYPFTITDRKNSDKLETTTIEETTTIVYQPDIEIPPVDPEIPPVDPEIPPEFSIESPVNPEFTPLDSQNPNNIYYLNDNINNIPDTIIIPNFSNESNENGFE